MTGYRWLKDIDLIQIKAMLWAGDPPRDISHKYLVTQATISNVKNGRQHYDIPWPDGSTGKMPDHKNIELMRHKKMGMLRMSEMRGGLVRTPFGLIPAATPVDDGPPLGSKERWFKMMKSQGDDYTDEQLEAGWLDKQEQIASVEIKRKAEDEAERQRHEKVRKEYARELRNAPKETKEDKAARLAFEKREAHIQHLWNKGQPVLDNFIVLSDNEITTLIQDDPNARRNKTILLDYIKARRKGIAGSSNNRGKGVKNNASK